MSQTQDQPEQYGVTPPISKEKPTPQEERLAEDLMKELRIQGTFESDEEARTREAVLGHVAKLVKVFVYQACIRRGLSEAAAKAAGGKIFTFGSYRLGVHGPGSDIDTLIVAPKHVDRQDFIEIFLQILQKDEWVTEANAVPDAFVPIIVTEIRGIPIDFTFARLALAVIPDDLELKDDSLLKNLDDKCVRSLNGSRCTDDILRLVPNVHAFRDALRAIKFWATRRAIYSNVNGFLGGVAWALLVARVCQLYPNGNAAIIVRRFFMIMRMWPWPRPVTLRKIEDGHLNMRVWNPKLYPSDRAHKMPIITPAYPSMCSTHNVMDCTLQVIKEELERGQDITTRIAEGQAIWGDLFEKHNFFGKYHYYLQVVASCCSQPEQSKWSGAVESKIRQLVAKLELTPQLERVHPFVKGFDKTYHTTNEKERGEVVLGILPPVVANRTEEEAKALGGEEHQAIYTTTYYIGLEIKRSDNAPEGGTRKLDISTPTSEFIKLARGWESYQNEIMGIAVRNIKNSNLPNDVFEGGQRPKKGGKRLKTKANGEPADGPASKRRRPSEETADGPVDPKSIATQALASISSSEFAKPGPPRTPVPLEAANTTVPASTKADAPVVQANAAS